MILVFGATGQVASELRGLPYVKCLGRAQADLLNPRACAAAITAHAPRAVINAAAYTAVDRAEDDADAARTINAAAPAEMAKTCAELGIPFVHISTDYVFDGSGTTPWTPDAPKGPLGVYGATKLAGEDGVRAAGGTHAILRTSWVVSAHGNNFLKTMLRLGADRDSLNIVADQIGGPTMADDIAATCYRIARQLMDSPEKTGTYHYSGGADCSWADFAREIFAQASLACTVTDIPSRDFPTPAARPLNSRLDCTATEQVFGIPRPDWRTGITRCLRALGRQAYDLAPPREEIEFDGERMTPWVRSPIWSEHMHRYISTLPDISDARVLDIACGEGYGAAFLARNGAKTVVGVDIDEGSIKRASRIYAADNLTFLTGSITQPLPFDDDSFDIITCFETIEHVAEQDAAIAELRRVLTPDGVLIISTPDPLHPGSIAVDNPFHVRELPEHDFRALLASRFAHTYTQYQRPLFGSMITDQTGGMGGTVTFWERQGFSGFVGGPTAAQPKYIVIRASDAPIDDPATGVLHDGTLGSLIDMGLRSEPSV